MQRRNIRLLVCINSSLFTSVLFLLFPHLGCSFSKHVCSYSWLWWHFFLPLKLSRGIIIAAKIGWSGYGQFEAMVKQELITDSFTQAEDRTIDHWCVIHTPYLSAITPKNYRRWSITFQPCYYFHFFLKNWLYGFSKERRCDNEEMSKNERLVQLSDKPNANSLKYAVSKKNTDSSKFTGGVPNQVSLFFLVRLYKANIRLDTVIII